MEKIKDSLEEIPERERWLYENPEALASVQRGLEEARRGEYAEAPDLEVDLKEFGEGED